MQLLGQQRRKTLTMTTVIVILEPPRHDLQPVSGRTVMFWLATHRATLRGICICGAVLRTECWGMCSHKEWTS